LCTGEVETKYKEKEKVDSVNISSPKQSLISKESANNIPRDERPYVPIDQILKDLINGSNSEEKKKYGYSESLSTYYQNSDLVKLKPKTASTSNRSERKYSKRLSQFKTKKFDQSAMDLPYLNGDSQDSFLSTKINLMHRFTNLNEKGGRGSHRTINLESQRNKISSLNLPQIEDTVEEIGVEVSVPKTMLHKKESDCTYQDDEEDQEEEMPSEGGSMEARNESPIKKWLSHNRNFDIKINLIVNKTEKKEDNL